MFTKPKVYNPDDLAQQAFVSFYYNKVRKRFLDGSQVGLDCSPNLTKTHRERQQELERLQYHIHHLLLAGWDPTLTKESTSLLTTDLQKEKLKPLFAANLSKRHVEDVLRYAEYFRKYLLEHYPTLRTSLVTTDIVQEFLNTFTSSAAYYMIARNRISGIFSLLKKAKKLSVNPVENTSTQKRVTKRNRAFTDKQFKQVLEYVKNQSDNLYLCMLLMYGCFLRPHEEIRNLKRDNFDEHLTVISMDGFAVKGRRLRVVPVPQYVRDEMIRRKMDTLAPDVNIFTRKRQSFESDEYFGTIWKRLKKQLLSDRIIQEDHTLYSVRHTAAVLLFKRTQDLPKLSQLMGHSDVNVTLVYLRSLGVLLNITENDLPII